MVFARGRCLRLNKGRDPLAFVAESRRSRSRGLIHEHCSPRSSLPASDLSISGHRRPLLANWEFLRIPSMIIFEKHGEDWACGLEVRRQS